jgi:hypothetical protein
VLIRWSFFQGFPVFNRGVEFEPGGVDDLVHRSAIENLYAAAVGRLEGVVRSWGYVPRREGAIATGAHEHHCFSNGPMVGVAG